MLRKDHHWQGFVFAAAAIALTLAVPTARSQVLYDGALGTPPGSQGWSFAALGSATQTLSNNAVWLDTSLSKSTSAGYAQAAPILLNRTNGFTLRFGGQLLAEAHGNTNRAGFSVIVLADDKRGIELGFWTNRIFAQADSPLFTHAEDVELHTDTALVEYALTILATNYLLRADGIPLLAGPVRDYTAFNGFPNPYRTPNFLFLGDDTTSASAIVSLHNLILIPAPVIACPLPGVLNWPGIPHETYRVEGTTNLIDWIVLGGVTSPSGEFWFTNTSATPFNLFRLAYP